MTEVAELPAALAPRTCPFDPPAEVSALREEHPVTRAVLPSGQVVWLVTSHELVRRLLADPRVSSRRTAPGFPLPVQLPPEARQGLMRTSEALIGIDPPLHTERRRMVISEFSVRRIAAMRPRIQQIVDDRIDAMLAGPNPTDLVEAFALPVPSLVICRLLGVPYADHGFFQDNSRTIIRRTATPEERSAASGRLVAYLSDLVERKLAEPGDDLLSELAGRVRDGELTPLGAAQMGTLLLIAGHETTANMIALGTLALLRHPEQLAALRDADDPAVVAAAVEELLRYLHITHNGRRRVALADIEVAGQVIRAGEGIIMANDIGNRDPAAFPDPDRLDLGRDARHHVAFGFGVHQCLGQPLARLELQVVYGTLYRRVPTLRLATELDRIPFKHDGSVYGVYELPVAW